MKQDYYRVNKTKMPSPSDHLVRKQSEDITPLLASNEYTYPQFN